MFPSQLRVVTPQADQQCEDVEIREFGEERYCYLVADGALRRYRIGRVLTFHPHEGDTNFDFEQRMDRTVQWLYAERRVVAVSLAFEKRAGAHVECVMTMVFPPVLAPIEQDARPAGGRFGARGGRGGSGLRRVS